jgi:valyl-tRNA synthetase
MPDAPQAEALTKFRKAYPSTAQMGKGFSACGADALRFTLCSYSPQARRIALSPGRIDGYRKFCNKLYNAIRFALPYLDGLVADEAVPSPSLPHNRWVLSRLGAAVTESTRGIEGFRLDESSGALYHFVWDELCDWYIELVKLVFQTGTDAEKAETQRTLGHVLETTLRALHPFLPFITEELWQRLPRPASRPASVALSTYPTRSDGPESEQDEREMGVVMKVISAARTIRSEHELEKSAKIPVELRADAATRALLEREKRFIDFLVGTEGASVRPPGAERPKGSVTSIAAGVEVFVGLRGLVDAKKEKDRLERRQKKVEKDVAVLEKRLANPSFVASAPAEVVAEARAQLDGLKKQLDHSKEALSRIDELQ